MIAKYMTTALIGSALLATAAVAQTSTTTMDKKETPAAAATTTMPDSSFHGTWRSSKVVGLNVYNESNEKLGSISELLLDKSGKIEAAVIGVGGFLGVGQHDVAVAFDKLKFVDTPVPSTSASTAPAGGAARPGMTTGAAPAAPAAASTKTNPWYPDHAVFNATKDQLKSMAQFKYTE